MTDPTRTTPENKIHPEPISEGFVAMSAFHKIADALDLSMKERAMVLRVSISSVRRWTTKGCRNPEALDRIALLVRIFDLAAQAFPEERGKQGWIRRSNGAKLFGDRPPLDKVSSGEVPDLLQICDYLKAAQRTW